MKRVELQAKLFCQQQPYHRLISLMETLPLTLTHGSHQATFFRQLLPQVQESYTGGPRKPVAGSEDGSITSY